MRIKDMVIEEQLKELEHKVLFLETRLQSLEARLLNLEFPAAKRVYGPIVDTRQIMQTCSKCGLKLNGVLSYSCTQVDCPTGLGPIVS